MNVIVGCERSGVVAGAFRRKGHNAYSCDILKAAEDHPFPEFHIQCDIREALRWKPWDIGIFHPDCTYLCGSGIHWNSRGIIGTRLRPYSQTIQPFQFGHDASKQTDLWLHNLPPLVPTKYVEPRWVCREGKASLPRWANQTDSGQNRLPPSIDRWELRAKTYQGIADAMAEQWGNGNA